jgi:hypothetical protein
VELIRSEKSGCPASNSPEWRFIISFQLPCPLFPSDRCSEEQSGWRHGGALAANLLVERLNIVGAVFCSLPPAFFLYLISSFTMAKSRNGCRADEFPRCSD